MSGNELSIGVTAAIAALVGVIVKAWPWLVRAVHFMDRLEAIEKSTGETATESKRAADAAAAAAEAAQKALEAADAARSHVYANGGTTLRDAIDRLEAQSHERISALEQRISALEPGSTITTTTTTSTA